MSDDDHAAHEQTLPPEPVVLAAFEGWNDAGGAATQALLHLHQVWDAEDVDALDPEEYHEFQENRTNVGFDEIGRRRVTWQTTTIAVARSRATNREIILVHGIEPSMRWRHYSSELLDIAERLGAKTIITLGALLADVPHTRPIPVTTTSDDPVVRTRLGLEPNTYEGPTGIIGVVHQAAADRGLNGLSLWAAVPHYVAHPPSPKATLALLAAVKGLLGETIAVGDLPDDAQAWQVGVDELAAEDSEIAEYVHQLEEAKDTADLPEASGEAIAREFERYLRRRDNGAGGRQSP